MQNIFYFGEKVKEYSVRVFNEREVRAGAGILFVFAFYAAMNALLHNNLAPMKLFIITF